MKIVHIALVTFVLLPLMASPAYAVKNDEAPPPADLSTEDQPQKQKRSFDLFRETDVDDDKIITRSEQETQAAAYFDRLDTNRDGALTIDELTVRASAVLDESKKPSTSPDQHKQAVNTRAQRHFTAIDTNKDGAVTRDEYINRARGRHEMMDADKSGDVSRAEYDNYRKRSDLLRRQYFMKNKSAVDSHGTAKPDQPVMHTPADPATKSQ